MFFPDMQLAIKEMARILKPGGLIALAVWGKPEDNPWVTATMGTIYEVLNVQRPPPDAPGIFRCAAPGFTENLLKGAGFKNISAQEVAGFHDFISGEMYWSFNTEVAAPVVASMSKATPLEKEQVRSRVFEKIHLLNPGGGAKLKYAAHLITATK
jgi:SAM-dependent methyltransferase